MPPLRPLLRHPAVLWAAYAVAWLNCGVFALERLDHARLEFTDANRADWNSGHAQIDFAGQWAMGRMFAADGRHLYHRDRLRETLQLGYPRNRESPGAPEHDVENLMGWFVGFDKPAGDGIGGPLYPPVHGLLYAPLAQLDPFWAYRTFQATSVGLAVFAGLAISRAAGGRVWFPLAALGVLLFPGCRGGLDLGQNHLLTLAVLAGGWWAMAGGRWVLGGAVWGLLAFKPVWAVSFLAVPLLMGQWRAAAAMCGTAAGLILLTLPVVGVQSWFDWLSIGRQAAAVYATNENWVSLSRDLGGLPRRLLIDFDAPLETRHSRRATLLGWGLWAAVVLATVVVYRRQRDRRPAGLPAAFLLLGAYLTCYRFMYYDATLSVLAVGVMLADNRTRRAWQPLAVIAALYVYENWLIYYSVELTLATGAAGGRYSVARPGDRLLTLAGSYRYAWDTAGLFVIWAWAGWRLLTPAEGVQGGADVGRPHERLADQHG